MEKTKEALILVEKERERQNQKWGVQNHDDGTWLMILTEEVGEVAESMQRAKGWGKETDANNKLEEIIHVCAVSLRMIEQILEEEERAKFPCKICMTPKACKKAGCAVD